jgi:predicted phage replisome organizer/uncharacterized phage protein (TIGR02220 family)
MTDVKWIKIVVDIFDDEKTLLIEAMPESDAMIVIWFKILCLAGKQNNGGVLMLNNRVAYTDEMLATIFRRPLSTVRLALSTFESLGMIEIVSGAVTIPNWGKHQNLEGIQGRRDYMKGYMREYRDKQKQLASGEETCKHLHKPNVSDAEEEREVELEEELEQEVEEDKEKDSQKENIKKEKKDSDCVINETIDYLNSIANKGFKLKTESIRKFIRARIGEGYTFNDFKYVIDNQWAKWKGTDMAEYMRPSTLFCAEKFPNYINAPDYSKVKPKPTGEPKGGVTRITPDFFTKLAKEHKENDT